MPEQSVDYLRLCDFRGALPFSMQRSVIFREQTGRSLDAVVVDPAEALAAGAELSAAGAGMAALSAGGVVVSVGVVVGVAAAAPASDAGALASCANAGTAIASVAAKISLFIQSSLRGRPPDMANLALIVTLTNLVAQGDSIIGVTTGFED